MKIMGFASLLVAAVIVLLIINVILMAYVMYKISNAQAYTFSTEGKVTNKDEGMDAAKLWEDNKLLLISPTVLNVLSVVILGLIYVMG